MMSASRLTIKFTLLPDGFGGLVRRRLIELGGVVLIALGLMLGLALVSYSPEDPSLNHATGIPVANLMGRPGAITVDILLQTVGLAAGLIALLLAAWGWRLLRVRQLRWWWLRVALLPAVVMLAAMALSTLSAPPDWPRPLDAYPGGFVGRMFLAALLPQLSAYDVTADIVATVSATIAAICCLFALAVSWSEWRTLARAIRWLMAALARVIRRFHAWRAGPGDPALRRTQAKQATRRERIEPALGSDDSAAGAGSPRLRPPDLVAWRPAEISVPKRVVPKKQGSLDLGSGGKYRLPPLDLLSTAKREQRHAAIDEAALAQNARLLESVLDDFGVNGQIVKVRPGPVVTLYELEPAPGTKTSRVIGLADDIARSMSAVSVRVAVIPGRNVIGIELPNAGRETVYLRELLASEMGEPDPTTLKLALGKDIGGTPAVVDLARMPHLLIAGTTGSGKSVAINTMILSLLYRLSPADCRFIMIDPKMLELSVYDGIPHLLTPVVTEPKKAIVALKWVVREMEERYRAMSKLGVRNIAGYNARLGEAKRKGEVLLRKVQTGFDESGQPMFEDQPLNLDRLPFIVVVVDEMADLMMVAGKEIEWAVQRLAQMARAAGIHLIMATQRPSVDVITGTIKANFPTRISFQVTSRIDSRTILGEQGAEQLLGQGDMLYMAGGGRILRVHGPFVSDTEVEQVVKHLKAEATPDYVEDVTVEEEDPGEMLGAGGEGGATDELYDQAVALVARERKASTSFIQRHLQIGYNRAARIVERMEAEGVVGAANHVGKREVLAPKGDYNA
ncbi:MAG: DNA translocase FtsK 4TM domain-containing protein [Proteobacteria bacterium]|nr:DNA translocase FtsK 4TM domain-containing protein [Pseudomonadota bacterium]